MADQMPFQSPGAKADFHPGLLHAVLAKERNAQFRDGANSLRRMAFADGDECDRGGIAFNTRASGGHALPDAVQIGGDVHGHQAKPSVSAKPQRMFMLCTAWPLAPLTMLSSALITISRPVRVSSRHAISITFVPT